IKRDRASEDLPFRAVTTGIVGETYPIAHVDHFPPRQPALTAPCQRNYPGIRDFGGTGTTAMIARGSQLQLEELAQRSFQLITRMLLILPLRRKRSPRVLKEMELLTLPLLHHNQSLIVGDNHPTLGVLPAPSSRPARS